MQATIKMSSVISGFIWICLVSVMADKDRHYGFEDSTAPPESKSHLRNKGGFRCIRLDLNGDDKSWTKEDFNNEKWSTGKKCDISSLSTGEHKWLVSGILTGNNEENAWEFCGLEGGLTLKVSFYVDSDGLCTPLEAFIFDSEIVDGGGEESEASQSAVSTTSSSMSSSSSSSSKSRTMSSPSSSPTTSSPSSSPTTSSPSSLSSLSIKASETTQNTVFWTIYFTIVVNSFHDTSVVKQQYSQIPSLIIDTLNSITIDNTVGVTNLVVSNPTSSIPLPDSTADFNDEISIHIEATVIPESFGYDSSATGSISINKLTDDLTSVLESSINSGAFIKALTTQQHILFSSNNNKNYNHNDKGQKANSQAQNNYSSTSTQNTAIPVQLNTKSNIANTKACERMLVMAIGLSIMISVLFYVFNSNESKLFVLGQCKSVVIGDDILDDTQLDKMNVINITSMKSVEHASEGDDSTHSNIKITTIISKQRAFRWELLDRFVTFLLFPKNDEDSASSVLSGLESGSGSLPSTAVSSSGIPNAPSSSSATASPAPRNFTKPLIHPRIKLPPDSSNQVQSQSQSTSSSVSTTARPHARPRSRPATTVYTPTHTPRPPIQEDKDILHLVPVKFRNKSMNEEKMEKEDEDVLQLVPLDIRNKSSIQNIHRALGGAREAREADVFWCTSADLPAATSSYVSSSSITNVVDAATSKPTLSKAIRIAV